MKKLNKNSKILIGVIISIIILIVIFKTSLSPLVITDSGTIKYAIPHTASFKCEPIEDKKGISISIPKDGGLISRETVGFNTNGISNIELSFTNSYWSTDLATRAGYATCDVNGVNCGAYQYIYDWIGGKNTLPLNSIDFTKNSLKLIYQRIPFYVIGGWQNSEGLKITFDGTAFGLRLYSTTQDPAGAKICTTSCNLDCPDIGYRQKLLLTDKTTLGFYDTAPYLEYWETIDYDLNKQGGATIYNEATNKFCFAGAIYNGATLKMDNGDTFIYPQTNTRQNKACCPGARISSTYSDLVCQNDYTWKVIQDTDKLTCTSDYNCPGLGGAICQSKTLSGYHCENKDTNGIGICNKEQGTVVECCVNGDCARDQTCDTTTHTCKGGSILPVCGDGKKDAGEQCDDGNTDSGDGCSTICEIEVEYCLTHPEDPVCSGNVCESCDAFALSTLIGSFWKEKQCNAKGATLSLNPLPQTPTLCWLSFVRYLLIPVILIFVTLIAIDFLDRYQSLKGPKNKSKRIAIALVLGAISAYIAFIAFIWGIIIGIAVIAFKIYFRR